MPGYEPFLLCDFHVHTRWSDGRLPLRDVVDLYGRTGRFDVIAITDHILMQRDLLARAGRLLTLGRREFCVTEARFDAYEAALKAEVAAFGAPAGYICGDSETFERIADYEAVFNRMIVYRSRSLHSASLATGFVPDPDPRTGRLTLNLFFHYRPKGTAPNPSPRA